MKLGLLSQIIEWGICGSTEWLDSPDNKDRQQAKQHKFATRFIWGTNEKYQGYVRNLQNSCLDVSTHNPATLHDAYNILQQ